MLKVEINLDRYSPNEIIDLCEQGIITVQEIIDSKRASSEFGNDLKNYIAKKQNKAVSHLDDTAPIHRSIK